MLKKTIGERSISDSHSLRTVFHETSGVTRHWTSSRVDNYNFLFKSVQDNVRSQDVVVMRYLRDILGGFDTN